PGGTLKRKGAVMARRKDDPEKLRQAAPDRGGHHPLVARGRRPVRGPRGGPGGQGRQPAPPGGRPPPKGAGQGPKPPPPGRRDAGSLAAHRALGRGRPPGPAGYFTTPVQSGGPPRAARLLGEGPRHGTAAG